MEPLKFVVPGELPRLHLIHSIEKGPTVVVAMGTKLIELMHRYFIERNVNICANDLKMSDSRVRINENHTL